MDFLGGETVEDKVFARRPRTVKNMNQFILETCEEIDANKDFVLEQWFSTGVHMDP